MCVICTHLLLGHMSVRARDSSWCSEEIVKESQTVPLNPIIIYYYIVIYMDGSVTMDQSGWVFTAKQGSRSADDLFIHQ